MKQEYEGYNNNKKGFLTASLKKHELKRYLMTHQLEMKTEKSLLQILFPICH